MQFYFNTGPNPMKVALCLEEMGLAYEAKPIDMLKGEQHSAEYLAVNPNAKVPALVDGDVTVFDSNAILLYLTEKTGRFVPEGLKARGELLSWLMFVATGIGPYSGQCVHFRHIAPEPKDYGVNRYRREVERHYGVLDRHLADRHYMLGDAYTIVDMALWGWARMLEPRVLGEGAFGSIPNVKRLFDDISARPAAKAAEALTERHAWKRDWDAEAHRFMFPQNVQAA